MQRIAIAIDDWKLPVFERHLTEAGYAFEKGPGVTPDTLTLTVLTSAVLALGAVIQAANTEARKSRSH